MKEQFMVQENNKRRRGKFYDYIVENYDLKINYPFIKELFVKSDFPFVIDFNDNTFWVCESIICCACAAENHKIISINEFKNRQ